MHEWYDEKVVEHKVVHNTEAEIDPTSWCKLVVDEKLLLDLGHEILENSNKK